jgi:hypothetical protein
VVAALLAFPLAIARAAPALVVDEPPPRDPIGRYALQVQENGTAVLHLQWSAADAQPHAVDLSLSAFTANGKPAIIVGFDAGKPAVQPYLRGVAVPAGGAAMRLVASGLEPGVSYDGTLTAIVDRQPMTWAITLIRPGTVPLFRCPAAAQTVRDDGSITFDVPRATPPGALAVDLRLSAFVSQDNERGDIGFAPAAGGTQLRDELTGFQVPGDRLTVALRARGLTEGAVYSGTLSLAPGGRDALDCPVTVAMPKLPRGELMTDRQSFVTTVTAPWLGTAGASVSLRMFEKTRTRPLYGITVELDGSAESPGGGFDLDRNATFQINGRPVSSLTQLPPEDLRDPARAIAPGGQLEVQIALHDLQVGKYAFGLRFNAANAVSPTQRIELTVNARHAWPWAVLAVVAALLVSFVLTKSIGGWRKRIGLSRRIELLRDQSFVEHSDLAIAVFLRVVLDQTEELLARHRFIPPPDSVDEYITRAERGARILTCYSSVAGQLRAIRCADRIKHYYQDAIADAILRVGPAPLDQATTDAIVEQLAGIEKGLVEPFPSYWANITSRGRVMAQQLRDDRQALRELAQVDKLVDALAHPEQLADPKPDDLRVAAYDRLYWFGRLLYARRNDQTHVQQLVQHCKPCQGSNDFPDVDLDGLFKDADRLSWERLKVDVPGRVKIQQLQPGQGPEALHPLRFTLWFENRSCADSYFVNNVLVYEWEFQFTPDKPLQRVSRIDSPVRVKQPRVTMYVPAAGKLQVRARIWWPTASASEPPLELEAKEFIIGPNQDLLLVNQLEASTVVYFGVMAAIAVATGLPTLYLDNPTFGSYADYVKILVWGIGIDQGKNLIQLVQSAPADALPSPPP